MTCVKSICVKAVNAIATKQVRCDSVNDTHLAPSEQRLPIRGFIKYHGNKDNGKLEVIVREPLENVVVAAEGLEEQSHAHEQQQQGIDTVVRPWFSDNHGGNDDAKHNNRLGSEKGDAGQIDGDAAVFRVPIEIQHQRSDLAAEQVRDEQQECQNDQKASADFDLRHKIRRQKNKGRKVELPGQQDQQEKFEFFLPDQAIEGRHQQRHGQTLLQCGEVKGEKEQTEVIENALQRAGRIPINQTAEADRDKSGDNEYRCNSGADI